MHGEVGSAAIDDPDSQQQIKYGFLLKPTTLISILLKPTTKYDLFTRTDFSGTTERFWGSIVRYSSNRGTYICTVFICKFKYLYFIYTGIFFK
jgi:hypothetical protein